MRAPARRIGGGGGAGNNAFWAELPVLIATGGQTMQCCDDRNRVLVDGKPLDEPYIHGGGVPGRPAAGSVPAGEGAGRLRLGDGRQPQQLV